MMSSFKEIIEQAISKVQEMEITTQESFSPDLFTSRIIGRLVLRIQEQEADLDAAHSSLHRVESALIFAVFRR